MRALDRGGGLTAPDLRPQRSPKSRVTLLIHGYQNTKEVAQAAYQRFLSHADLEPHSLVTGEICEVYWPGDTDWPGYREGHRLRNALTGTLSVLSYALKVSVAREAGEHLKNYFTDLARLGPVDVSLICHSLGNRVGLEFIAACYRDRNSNVRVSRACLMAAAVPVEKVIDGGALHAAASTFVPSVVLYSRSDEALGPAFEIGQAFALEYSSGAVGRHGYPTSGTWSNRVDMQPHSHGDYWNEPQSAWEARVVFGGARVAYTRTRGLLSRWLPNSLGVPQRETPSRTLFSEQI